MVQDDRFDDLIHVRLTGHLVERVRRGQEGGAEHDGQVPSIHHVLVAVLGEAEGKGDQSAETFGNCKNRFLYPVWDPVEPPSSHLSLHQLSLSTIISPNPEMLQSLKRLENISTPSLKLESL